MRERRPMPSIAAQRHGWSGDQPGKALRAVPRRAAPFPLSALHHPAAAAVPIGPTARPALDRAAGQALTPNGASLAGSPVQLVKVKGKTVEPEQLSTKQLYKYINALTNKAVIKNVTWEKGDEQRLIEEVKRRNTRTVKKSNTIHGINKKQLNDDEDFKPTKQEMLMARVLTEGRFFAGLDKIRYDKDTKEEKEGYKLFSEKSIQGTMGELAFQQDLESKKEHVTNLNEISLNFGGLDHLIEGDKQFHQSKLHLAQGTANVNTYERHLDNSEDYAIKAVRSIAQKRRKIIDFYKQIRVKMPSKLQKVIKKIDDLDSMGDDEIEGSEAHQIVSKGMVFGVPLDIYKKIDSKKRPHYRALSYTTGDFRSMMDELEEEFKPSSAKRQKEDDEEYQPDD